MASGINTIAFAGKFGVDVFFVLSSYLITTLLIRERESRGKIDVKAFYVRRILRIWPLYFAFILIALITHFVIHDEGITWRPAIWFLAFAGNWLQVFHLLPASTSTRPLWSVSVEEQFYLTWPLLLRRATTKRIVLASTLLLVCANVSRVIVCWKGVDDPAVWTNTFTRLDPIALGALVAIGLRKSPWSLTLSARLILIGCAVSSFLLVSRFAHMADASFVGTLIGYPIIALSSALLVACSILPTSASAVVGRLKLLIDLGKISFGLYIFHEFVVLLVEHAMGSFRRTLLGFPLYWTGGLLLTIAIAWFSYTYLEQPFLSLKQRFTFVPSRPTDL